MSRPRRVEIEQECVAAESRSQWKRKCLDQEGEGVTMQKDIARPVHRSTTQRADESKQEVWPLLAREFMKLPASGLLSAGK